MRSNATKILASLTILSLRHDYRPRSNNAPNAAPNGRKISWPIAADERKPFLLSRGNDPEAFFQRGMGFQILRYPGYLRIIEGSDQVKTDLSGLRIIDLAEVIYNLQHVPNFDSCIARMCDGDIEGTAAELDLGRKLYLNQIPFQYVTP
jgi:hypothetical protein